MNLQGTSYFIGPRVVRNGLVVHLDTANPKSYPGTGNIVFDISPEGLQRNATFTGEHLIDKEGIYFDGITGRGTIAQPSVTFRTEDVLQEWSICFFIKTDNDAGWLISPQSSGADHAIIYSTANSGRITFFVTERTDVGNRNIPTSAGSVPPNNVWTYCVCTLKGIEMNAYINGQLDFKRINDLPITNWAGTWHIANRAFNLGQYFRGTLQNIHIYNRELTAEEVLQNFNAFKGRFKDIRYIERRL